MPRALLSLSAIFAFGLSTLAQPVAKPAGTTPHTAAATPGEQRTIRAFNAARKNPLTLNAFLVGMPKGGDLHMHLSGAIYAETFIKDAATDTLCFSPSTRSLFKPAATTRSLPPQPVCGKGNERAMDAFTNQSLYDAMVDAFSMRSFVPTAGVSAHDQFFATFARFGAIDKSHTGEWIDEVASRAAAQNEQYLEIMETPIFSNAAHLAQTVAWPGDPRDPDSGTTREELAKLRDELLAAGLRNEVSADRKEIDDALASRSQIEHCGQPTAAPACSVNVKFIYQILRGHPPQQVFAQTLLGFEVTEAEAASGNPRVVGINFVMPEDGYLSMSEYHRQMLMLDYLHSVYPRVHISLHAGELAPGLVPPDGLRFHVREAIELGHAERIGHGVDVMYETNPSELLKEMASRHIMTEINLTSNDVILGVSKEWHPLPSYRAAGVPVALSTDDEGVSRIDITHEYTRAALDFNLSYLDLKKMARTSLEHSFLHGASLWAQPDDFTRVNAACASQQPGNDKPTQRCADFLKSSEKATQQWQLEHRYQVFEANIR